ncbi:MAG: Inorganic pyrophosphatase [Acidobacteria bacterium]|nr:Inorganic pyrophosphatase [Acidobacteriota bacterium]
MGKPKTYAMIETPKGSRSTFKFDEELNAFRLSNVLAAGSVFPFDFGYLPGTRGEDGDPLDVLVLLDSPTPMGCLVEVRLLGVIKAQQTDEGRRVRNDRLIAAAVKSPSHGHLRALSDVAGSVLEEIEHFFSAYNAYEERPFKILGRGGPAAAARLLAAARTAPDQ